MTRGLHWFRADLRLRDNTALAAMSDRCSEIAFAFVLDEELLASAGRQSARVRFLLDSLDRLANDLAKRGHTLQVERGDSVAAMERLLAKLRPDVVSVNRSTTPWARRRDARARRAVEAAGAEWCTFKDAVVFEAAEVRTQAGELYRVFTPYRRAWQARLQAAGLPEPAPLRLPMPVVPATRDARRPEPWAEGRPPGHPEGRRPGHPEGRLPDHPVGRLPGHPVGGEAAARRRLAAFVARDLGRYAETRNRPDLDATSRLSPYLRFGALSVRDCFRAALSRALGRAVGPRGGGALDLGTRLAGVLRRAARGTSAARA